MSARDTTQAASDHREQAKSRLQRAYTITEICQRLSIPRSTFFHLRQHGQLPFLEELQPRLGRVVRYRADLVDRYADGRWDGRRAIQKAS